MKPLPDTFRTFLRWKDPQAYYLDFTPKQLGKAELDVAKKGFVIHMTALRTFLHPRELTRFFLKGDL